MLPRMFKKNLEV